MKIKTISRNEEQYTRETTKDLFRVYRNYDPEQHPFERAREYTRALVATKMDRMFAKVCMCVVVLFYLSAALSSAALWQGCL